MTKTNSFIKQFIAKLKGDNNEEQAQKAWRNAEAALKLYIAQYSADLLNKEDDVADAEVALDIARVNGGNPIADKENYIETLIRSKRLLDQKEQNYKAHVKTLNFLQEEYEKLKQ